MNGKSIVIGVLLIAAITAALIILKEPLVQTNPIRPASGGGLIKSPQNPLLKEGEAGSWMALKADPTVIKDGDTYKMWFTGAGENFPQQIAYAFSENGIDWNVLPEPVFSAGDALSWDRHAVETVSVIKDGDTYKMWYSGWTTEDLDEITAAAQEGKNILPAIGYATSKDGIVWQRHEGGPVIGQQKGILWHGLRDHFLSFSDPHVIKEDGIYKMWFHSNGSNSPYPDLHEIGYATSKDGIEWELYPQNPVLAAGEQGSFESFGVFEPSVIKRNGIYEMWYGASPTLDIDGSVDGIKALRAYMARATSRDGIVWQRDPENPIFGPQNSGSGTWEEDGAFMQTVLMDGDTLKMWYVGVGRQGKFYPDLTRGLQYQIGYAEK